MLVKKHNDKDIENTCYCRCGSVFKIYARSYFVGITYRTLKIKEVA